METSIMNNDDPGDWGFSRSPQLVRYNPDDSDRLVNSSSSDERPSPTGTGGDGLHSVGSDGEESTQSRPGLGSRQSTRRQFFSEIYSGGGGGGGSSEQDQRLAGTFGDVVEYNQELAAIETDHHPPSHQRHRQSLMAGDGNSSSVTSTPPKGLQDDVLYSHQDLRNVNYDLELGSHGGGGGHHHHHHHHVHSDGGTCDFCCQTKKRRYQSLKVLCTTVLLVTLIGVVTVGLVLVLQNGDQTDSNNNSNDETVSIVIAPPNPDELAMLCSLESISTVAGYKVCQEQCEVADCCRVPEDEVGCYEENENICEIYATACQNLSNNSNNDGGGDSVEDEEGDYGDDGDSHPPPLPETEITDEPLPETAAAAADAGSEISIPPAPHNLDEVCDPIVILNVDGFTACEEKCLLGECCYSNSDGDGVATNNNCYDSHPDECERYSPCKVLAETQETTTNTMALTKDAVDEACASDSNEYVNVPGHQSACDAICETGSCCFSAGEEGCDVDCNVYASCEEVFETAVAERVQANDDVIPLTKEAVDEACSEESVVVPGQKSACETLCEVGSCCFTGEGTAACDADCGVYTSCEELFETAAERVQAQDNVIPLTKEAIDEACSEESVVVPGQKSACETLCEVGSCCFTGEGEEGTAVCNLDCDVYAACTPAVYVELVDIPDKSQIDEVCAEGVVSKPGGSLACETACTAGSCCFEGDGGDECAVNCHDFNACAVLYQEMDEKEVIDRLCIGNRSTTECLAVCSEGSCCFEGRGDECDVVCDAYDVCAFLYQENTQRETS